ncbi:MAG: DNA mismatch repair endonuclease MutL [Spirochaetes bacterium]|nr:DNA mismatch repair endonuclease MutL [Spirochaetota bacterium]
MDRIRLLPDIVKKKIAAGEVVEGPFSVVKELLENSIDAGAERIDVQVADGGLKKILVRDDGRGMHRDDIRLAVAEHATSKIEDIHDIERIASYGFRGEALSSISSVSRLAILSRRADEESGGRLTASDGNVQVTDFGGPSGTTVIVENLFYNVPARKKFLKSARTELRLIRETLLKIALPHPEIAFSLDVDDARTITLPRADGIEERLAQVYGGGIMNDLYHETLRDLKVAVSGFLSRPHFLKSNRAMQLMYVNMRPVEYRYLGFLLSRAYEAVAGRGKYPAGIIFIDIDPGLVDVNIHPAKKEVKLFDGHYIDRLIISLAEKAVGREHRIDGGVFAAGGAVETDRPAARQQEAASGESLSRLPGIGSSAPVTAKPSDLDAPSEYMKDVSALYHDIERSRTSRIIGIAFGTFILVEKGDALYFIDFHAAHERILYDSLLDTGASFESQRLAFPSVMELSIQDHALVLENIDKFSQIGFDIEDFSDHSLSISAVPEIARGADPLVMLEDFLAGARGEGRSLNTAEAVAATVACHAAKRAGDGMTQADMEKLVDDVFSEGYELRCPHGRPFVYRLEKADLEKMFKRQPGVVSFRDGARGSE